MATEPSHCEGSEGCKNWGQCVPYKGFCVATKEEHCAVSVGCRLEGVCVLGYLTSGRAECVHPTQISPPHVWPSKGGNWYRDRDVALSHAYP